MLNYKKIFSGFFIICALLCAQGKSMEQNPYNMALEGTNVKGLSARFSVRSIKQGDDVLVAQIDSQCAYKEGFNLDPMKWSQNLILRQEKGNPYSGLVLSSKGDATGFLCFGRMTTLGYDPKFTDIIDTYLGFNIIKLVDENGDRYAQSNLVRVENRGLGLILPVLPESLGLEGRTEALKIGIAGFQLLKNNGHKLPFEATVPTHLIGLFHPDDTLIPALEAAGFDIIRKEGFFGYYDKPRVMAHIELK